MSNRTDATKAAELFAKNADSAQAMRVIAFYYLTKFPQFAQDAFKAVDSFPGPAYAGAGASHIVDIYKNVTIRVPEGSNQIGAWRSATYEYPLYQVREWASICRRGDKVAAIKRCRADTNLGLKEAKDLCEYVATQVW